MLSGPEHPLSEDFQRARSVSCRTAAEVHVWRVPLDCAAPEVLRLTELMSADERERADRFHFLRDRERFIAVRARLRILLGRYLDREPASLQFRYGYAGKPELTGPGIPFNVSHSGDIGLIALGGPGRIGVDVERIQSATEPDLFHHFFTPAEEAALARLPPELRLRAFFACWTRKEAYIKGRGDGLSFGLDRFEVSVLPDLPAKLLSVPGDPDETARWELRSFDAGPGYAAALAVDGHGWPLRSFDWRSAD